MNGILWNTCTIPWLFQGGSWFCWPGYVKSTLWIVEYLQATFQKLFGGLLPKTRYFPNSILGSNHSNGWFPKAMDLSRHRFVNAYATSSNSPTASPRAARDNDCEDRNAGVGRVWGKVMVKSIFLGWVSGIPSSHVLVALDRFSK